jgi:hypothetical protein
MIFSEATGPLASPNFIAGVSFLLIAISFSKKAP